MRRIFILVAATVAATFTVTAAQARCTKLAYSVNDYGKDGPTRDAKSGLDTYVAKWAAERGIKKYTTGTKAVTCELYLDVGIFDEHTCKAEALVCWDGTATSGAPKTAAAPGTATTAPPVNATPVKATPLKATPAKATPTPAVPAAPKTGAATTTPPHILPTAPATIALPALPQLPAAVASPAAVSPMTTGSLPVPTTSAPLSSVVPLATPAPIAPPAATVVPFSPPAAPTAAAPSLPTTEVVKTQ